MWRTYKTKKLGSPSRVTISAAVPSDWHDRETPHRTPAPSTGQLAYPSDVPLREAALGGGPRAVRRRRAPPAAAGRVRRPRDHAAVSLTHAADQRARTGGALDCAHHWLLVVRRLRVDAAAPRRAGRRAPQGHRELRHFATFHRR